MASTLDVLPTIASLAGAKLPQVLLDGVDMTEILVKQGQVEAAYLTLWRLQCCENQTDVFIFIFNSCLQSKRETMVFYPTDPSEMYGLYALRLGKYKAHFYTRGT